MFTRVKSEIGPDQTYLYSSHRNDIEAIYFSSCKWCFLSMYILKLFLYGSTIATLVTFKLEN